MGDLADRFFGGIINVQKKLVDAIRTERERQGISPEELDKRCFFKFHGYPTCREFETNPSLMNGFHFSLASANLRISSDYHLCLDSVLKVDLSDPADMEYVVNHIKNSGAYVTGLRPEDASSFKPEDFAPMYLLLKIMEEIEPQIPAYSSDAA